MALNWQQVQGGLVQIAAAGDVVWGVNGADQIWRWNGSGWDTIGGSACHVSVGWDGSVWVCNKAGQVYRWHGNPAVANGWQQMEGNVNSLAVRAYNDVWATNGSQQVWHFDGTKWSNVDGQAVQIAVGKDGHVACVNAAGMIHIRDGLHSAWQHIPGAAKQVAVHKKGVLGCVNGAGQIFLWENNNWRQANGEAHWISLARGHKDVWVVNRNSTGIFHHAHGGSSGKAHYKGYNWQQVQGGLVKVAGAGKNVWGVNAQDQIWRWNGHGWDSVGGAACEISVGYDGSVWVANRAGTVYRWHGNPAVSNGWQQMEGNVNSLAVRSYNDVWATNSSHNVWHWDGMAWNRVDGAANQIAVGKDGHVACVNAAGMIHIRDGLHGAWQHIPGQATQIALNKKGNMACVNAAGMIHVWNNGSWTHAPGEAHWIALPKGHKDVWVTNQKNGSIFRHNQ